MIYIDFQGGTHGNYLEFVCNTLLANTKSVGLPFNQFNSAHDKKYITPIIFKAGHYYYGYKPNILPLNSKIISIHISVDDLLPLTSISLLRAGDYGLDNDTLEIDTYHKLSNLNYQSVLDTINQKFFVDQISNSYNAVAQDSWPPVKNIEEFNALPSWIKNECLDVHKLILLPILSKDTPHCPRYVLREFFKIGFKDPNNFGFITNQASVKYDSSMDVYYFPFSCFYNVEKFETELKKVAIWANLPYNNNLAPLHAEFLNRQPYKDSKKICDKLLEQILKKEMFNMPHLDLMMESYLSAKLELIFNKEIPDMNIKWFTTSKEIIDYFEI